MTTRLKDSSKIKGSNYFYQKMYNLKKEKVTK